MYVCIFEDNFRRFWETRAVSVKAVSKELNSEDQLFYICSCNSVCTGQGWNGNLLYIHRHAFCNNMKEHIMTRFCSTSTIVAMSCVGIDMDMHTEHLPVCTHL